MAGRKQHYIPQIVQRAFEAARTGTKSQVFVFRKGRREYLTSTEGSAAERDFYSNPNKHGKGALDDKITDFESAHLTPILQKLRSIGSGEVDPELAAITVGHLAFRTAHIRETMTDMFDIALDEMKTIVADPAALRLLAEIDSDQPTSAISERMREDLSQSGFAALTEKDRNTFERIIRFRLRERFDDLVAATNGALYDMLATTDSTKSDLIANAHARALSESMIPQERVRTLRELNWNIIAADTRDRHFILPDCVVVASSSSLNDLKPFTMISSDEAMMVIMPLSSHQLLIGSSHAEEFEQAGINLQLAKCSLDFFISSKQDRETATIAKSIGICAEYFKLDKINEEEGDSKQIPPWTQLTVSRLKVKTPTGKFGNAVKKIIIAIAKGAIASPVVERIESISVVSDMQVALTAILKRTPSAAELQAEALGTVQLVKIGSEWKCHVVVPRNVAEMLVQTTDLIATRLIKINLGRVYYIDCWARQYPEVFTPPEMDVWRHIVIKVVCRATPYYFGGLASARHEPEPMLGGDSLQELASSLRLVYSTSVKPERITSFIAI